MHPILTTYSGVVEILRDQEIECIDHLLEFKPERLEKVLYERCLFKARPAEKILQLVEEKRLEKRRVSLSLHLSLSLIIKLCPVLS